MLIYDRLSMGLYGKKTRNRGEIDKEKAEKARQTAEFDSLPGFDRNYVKVKKS